MSGFTFGAPTTQAASKPAGLSFGSFGTTQPFTGQPAAPSFGLGSSAASTTTTSGLSFGATAATTAPSAQSAFGFGAKPAAPTATTATTLSFGLATQPAFGSSAPSTTTTASTTFGFGLAPKTTAATTTSTGGFTGFGLPATTTSATTTAGGLSFGLKPVTTTTTASASLFSPLAATTTATTTTTASSGLSFAGLKPATTSSSTAAAAAAAVSATTSAATTSTASMLKPGTATNTTTSTTTTTTSTAAATAAPAPATPTLTYRQLEEMVNKWTYELDEQSRSFAAELARLNKADSVLIANAEKITDLHAKVEACKAGQSRIEQELEFVESQQRSLEDLLEPLERAAAAATGSAGDLSSSGGGQADAEREALLQMCVNTDLELAALLAELRDMAARVNSTTAEMQASAANASTADGVSSFTAASGGGGGGEKTEGELEKSSSVIGQVTRILNSHMHSLTWLSQNTQELMEKMKLLNAS